MAFTLLDLAANVAVSLPGNLLCLTNFAGNDDGITSFSIIVASAYLTIKLIDLGNLESNASAVAGGGDAGGSGGSGGDPGDPVSFTGDVGPTGGPGSLLGDAMGDGPGDAFLPAV